MRWLAYIVTAGAHRNASLATYRNGMHHTLSRLTAQASAPLDVRDARWRHLWKPLRKPA